MAVLPHFSHGAFELRPVNLGPLEGAGEDRKLGEIEVLRKPRPESD